MFFKYALRYFSSSPIQPPVEKEVIQVSYEIKSQPDENSTYEFEHL